MNILSKVQLANANAEWVVADLRAIVDGRAGSPIERAAIPHLLKRAQELQSDLYQLQAAIIDTRAMTERP